MPRDPHRPTDRARQLRREATFPERLLWSALRDRRLAAWKFRRQVPIGPYIADFLCHSARLILEIDGQSHDNRAEADRHRQCYLESAGYTVLRLANDDVLNDRAAVLDAILLMLTTQQPPPLSGPR